MKVTKTLIKKYSQRIGKENFITGYYYTKNKEQYKLAVKALTMDIFNFMDKVNKQRELSKEIENNTELKENINHIVNIAYINICL